MSALPYPYTPQSNPILAGRTFTAAPGFLANPVSDELAARSRSFGPALNPLFGVTSSPGAAATYGQNKLLGRGSSSGTGIAEAITLGSNISLSGTTVNVSATGGSGSGGLDPQTAIYPAFTVGSDDDEFNDGSFSGWTAVNDGSNVPTVTETNNVCSVSVPGGHAAGDLAAYLKAATVSANDYIEMVFRGCGRSQNFNVCGLIMSDGTTYGAGAQVLWYYSPQESAWWLNTHANFSAPGTTANYSCQTAATLGDMFMRLKYLGGNNWTGYVSPDGVSWIDLTGSVSRTLTPTKIGFFVTSWGGSLPFAWSLRYFKHSA